MCPSLNGGHYVMVGFLAGGLACGVQDVPDIFSSTIFNNKWIFDTISEIFPPISEKLPDLQNTTASNTTPSSVSITNINNSTGLIPKVPSVIEVKKTLVADQEIKASDSDSLQLQNCSAYQRNLSIAVSRV